MEKILVIGNGRLANHFCHYFRLIDVKFEKWDRTQAHSQLVEKAKDCTSVLILISDQAIESFAAENDKVLPKLRLHCSGSLFIKGMIGAHPLMTFSENLFQLPVYQKIVFAIDTIGFELESISPKLQNSSFQIKPDEKAFYHALCVASGSFSYLLWQFVAREFAARNWSQTGLNQYSQAIFENIQKTILKPELNLATGPIQRGDQETIQRNLAALKGSPLEMIYFEFAKAFAGAK